MYRYVLFFISPRKKMAHAHDDVNTIESLRSWTTHDLSSEIAVKSK